MAAMAVIGVAFGLVIVAMLKYLVFPVEGVVTANGLKAAREAVAPKPEVPNELGGLYVEFKYPGMFDSLSQIKTDANALEQYNITSRADYRRGIAVHVRDLPNGRLADDSSYRFRQLKADQYRLSELKMHGEPAVRASKLDKQEATLFWAHKGRLVTIAVTAMDPDDDVEAILKTISDTLRWRQ